MNVRDSEFVAGILIDDGFALTERMEKADIVIFNSCSVREHAEEKLFSNIAEAARLKKKRPGLVLVLMGCTAQRYKAQAAVRVPDIDIVCGPGNEPDMPALIRDVIRHRSALVATDKADAPRPELFPEYRSSGFKAYVSISEGCDNFCSYCVVPYLRGRERSRDEADIVKEVRDLGSRGFREITLLGQNVNSYRRLAYSVQRIAYRERKLSAIRYPLNAGTSDFVRLLEALNGIKGIERIRFMTSHPKDAGEDLFRAMAGLDKVCEHLHLPLQSGSDRILKLMNRGYTPKRYMEAVRLYRKHVPEGSVTTDVVVGFPSESEKDFAKTRDVMGRVGFDSAFTFKYSPRPPARSAKLKDDVPEETKTRRLLEIVELQCRSSLARNRALVGKTVEVLADGTSKKDPSAPSGRTRTNKTVVFGGPKNVVGRFVRVKVTSATPYSLKGRMVT